MKALAYVALACLACACGGVKHHGPDAYPDALSEWGLISLSGDRLALGDGVFTYDLNTPLFSDYALKYRTLYLPEGTAAEYHDVEAFDFPVGTIVTKTFFYRNADDGTYTKQSDWQGDLTQTDLNDYTLVETRLLVRQTSGWDALPYVWKDDDAYLDLTGELFKVTLDGQQFAYTVPSRNECGGCHVTNHTAGTMQPIGLKARHIPTTQLTAWSTAGHLTGIAEQVPQNATEGDAQISHAARSYLDINCGHCHNAKGAADTSGLLLDYAERTDRQLGVCKPPIAVGRGSGDRLYSIVPGAPEESILTYRMQTTDPGQRMPEVGRALTHEEGVDLIARWIAQFEGEC